MDLRDGGQDQPTKPSLAERTLQRESAAGISQAPAPSHRHQEPAVAQLLSVTRLSGPGALLKIAKEWEDLETRTSPRTPFSSPLWNSLWWKHYARNDLVRSDDFLVLLLRSANKELVGVAPLFRSSSPGMGPAWCRIVQFFGADASITEVRGPICAPENLSAVMSALWAYFQHEYREWDLLRWDGLREGAQENVPLGGLFGAPAHQPNYFVRLPASWAELHSQITGNFRRNMRKQREFFEADGHAYQVRVIDRPAAMRDALNTLFDLHTLRAQAESMDVRHPDRFANSANRQFVTEYAVSMASCSKAHIFEFVVGTKLVASQLTFTMGKDLWLYASGFDPNWRRYGVMTMLTIEVMQWALRSNYEIVNLSCGHDRGKSRWRPSEITFTHVLEKSLGLRGRLAMRSYRALNDARHLSARLRGYRSGKRSDAGIAPDAV
jgi:CelD/BcsL family acetyltransferase involved in cellulose biosynthesis